MSRDVAIVSFNICERTIFPSVLVRIARKCDENHRNTLSVFLYGRLSFQLFCFRYQPKQQCLCCDKERMVSMKAKRFVFAVVLAFTVLVSAALTALAAKEGTITDSDAHLNGYIAGVEGVLTLTDKIWYNANLTGSEDEIECVVSPEISHGDGNTAYVIPGTDKKTLSKVYLYDQKRMVSGDEVSCGYGGHKAILKMHLCSVDSSIEDKLQ